MAKIDNQKLYQKKANENYIYIGTRIKKKRKLLGWSQERMAELCNFSIQHISNIERGHSTPSLKSLIYIANTLNVSIDELLCDYIFNSKVHIHNDIACLLEKASENQIKVICKVIEALLNEWNRVENTYSSFYHGLPE